MSASSCLLSLLLVQTRCSLTSQPYFHLRLFLNCSSIKGEPSSLSSLLSSSTTSVDTSKLAQILAVAVDQERYLCYWILFNGKNIRIRDILDWYVVVGVSADLVLDIFYVIECLIYSRRYSTNYCFSFGLYCRWWYFFSFYV